LPDDYDGRSGWVQCKDGMPWYVVNIPAKCERADDPLGRQIGEYMWPEWFPPAHWAIYENGSTREQRRTWGSLYQQRPTPEGSGDFKREDFNWYDPGEEPMNLHLVGASDYAVTKDAGDFSEHGVGGLDTDGNLWLVDWWSGQVETDVSIDAFINILQRYNIKDEERGINMWVNEGGVIDKSIRPTINKAMREAEEFVDLRTLPNMNDKRAKCKAFGAMVSAGAVWLPRGCAWAEDLVSQLCAMPAGRYDDKADVVGLMGRMIDKFIYSMPLRKKKSQGIQPFTAEWLEHTPTPLQVASRYR
jgi:predicted phage terminase large subunit-like protein